MDEKKKKKKAFFDILKSKNEKEIIKAILNKHNAELQRKPTPEDQSNILYTRCIIISHDIIDLDTCIP